MCLEPLERRWTTILVKGWSGKSLMEQSRKVPYHPGTDWGYCTSLTKGVLQEIILLSKRAYCWTSSDVQNHQGKVGLGWSTNWLRNHTRVLGSGGYHDFQTNHLSGSRRNHLSGWLPRRVTKCWWGGRLKVDISTISHHDRSKRCRSWLIVKLGSLMFLINLSQFY